MKCLLLPLLAALALPAVVNALPWDKKNKDIIIKTDLNEEYIVKDSTVTIRPWSKIDAIKALQRNHPIDICSRGYRKKYECQFEYLFSEKETKHLKMEKILINTEISTPINRIRFRPIFVDLNGSKSANKYYDIACMNFDEIVKLNEMDRAMYLDSLNPSLSLMKSEIPEFNSGLAIEALKKAVCKKYNDFEDSDFSLDDPQLIKRKYYSGFSYQLVKGKVKIVNVNKGSDAEKYLKVNDEILEVNNIKISSVDPTNIYKVISLVEDETPMKIKIKRKKEEFEFLIKKEQRY